MSDRAAQSVSQPLRIQLALQGGGARIVALMAAMEAVQTLQRQDAIKVTRIAGTSAGAIVGALFAAGVDLGEARRSLIKSVGDTVIKQFPPPSAPRLIWQLAIRQRPLWDQIAVKNVLEPLFDKADVHLLRDLHRKTDIHIHIAASDLADGGKVMYTDEKNGDKFIVSAMLDSCAIPYCFRIWPQWVSPIIVDGGICENLPSDELLEHQATDGPVVAIGFDTRWPGCPTNIKTFSLALLDTAMSNSIVRAKSRLGDRIHSISTDLTTFDFEKASMFHEDTAFRIRAEAADFFRNFLERQRPEPSMKTNVRGDPWAEMSIPIMESLWKVYAAQHSAQKSTCEFCSLIVHAHCLIDDPDDDLYGTPDFVTYRVRFRPLQDSYCSTLSVIPHEGTVSLSSSEISVRNEADEPVDFVLLPARDPSATTKRPALIFFTPALPAGSGPYTLELKQRLPEFMSELKGDRKSEMFLVAKRAAETVGRIDLVLHVPKALGTAAMQRQGDGPGRPMTPAELMAYEAEPGFRSLGWRGEQIPAGMKFAVDIVL